MKALTIWQPWASLIAIGAKPYEFRKWVPSSRLFGTRIAIHAGVRKPTKDELADLVYRLERGEAAGTALKAELALPLLQKVRQGFELPMGAVLGTAKFGYPLESRSLPGVAPDAEINPFGKYAWPLGEFRPFEPPIAAKGEQGFWEWRQEAVAP